MQTYHDNAKQIYINRYGNNLPWNPIVSAVYDVVFNKISFLQASKNYNIDIIELVYKVYFERTYITSYKKETSKHIKTNTSK